jgi:hypothetical protein
MSPEALDDVKMWAVDRLLKLKKVPAARIAELARNMLATEERGRQCRNHG